MKYAPAVPRLLRAPLLAVTGFALCSAVAAASTYYVSPGGNDANDGLSQSTPWQTVARVNASAFQPGDAILFQRGGEWHESLDAPSSGTNGNPITFADYGNGAKPKFWGSVPLNNSQFVAQGGGIYTYAFGAPVYSVLANQVFFNYNNGTSAGNVPGAWSYGGGQIIINSPNSDPRYDGRLYSAVLRDDVVYSNYKSHLVFRNLITDESARYDDNGGYGFRIMGSQDVLVTDCEAYHAGKHNFGVINSTQFVGQNLVAAYAAPGQGAGGASAYVSYGDGSTGLSGQTSEWHNITASHMEDPQDNTTYDAFVDHGSNLGSVLLDRLQSYGSNVTITNEDNPAGTAKVTGGLIQNARMEVGGTGVMVDGTEFSGPAATIDVTGNNAVLQNLLVHGTNLGGAWYQTAVLIRGTNNILRFSTVDMDPASGGNSCVAVLNANGGLQMYGNILLAPQRALALWSQGLNLGTFAASAFNFYAPGATFASWVGGDFQWRDVPLLQWQSTGFDGGSLQGDPKFVNRAGGNYHLSAGSPAIDAAPLSPYTLTSLLTDLDGSPRPQGSAYDMGAFESGSTATAQPAPVPVNPAPAPAPAPTPAPTPAPAPAPAPAPQSYPITLASPVDGQNVNGVLVVTAIVPQTLDAAGSRLMVDGQFLDDHRVVSGPYLYILDTTQLSPGAHQLQIWAHDISNNTLMSNPVTVTVAN